MDSLVSPKYQQCDEVTGVSRSGRIRKKPSKLTDFGSRDDPTDKPKKQIPQRIEFPGSYESPGPSDYRKANSGKKCNSMNAVAAPRVEYSSVESESSGSAYADGYDASDLPSDTSSTQAGFMKLEVPRRDVSDRANSGLAPGKNKKNIIIKGGKVVGAGKTQRKDKGKARFTAYVLWAKDARQRLVEERPDMDFTTLSKRLGELWSTVPHTEKRNWRRRAKRLVFNLSSKYQLRNDPTWPLATPLAGTKFINATHTAKQERTSLSTKKTKHAPRSSMKNLPTSSSSSHATNQATKIIGNREKLRAVGTQPIDVAAHLTLLGESLTVIGELLANHKGEIAVSGGLSVLLDSLLCAMAPLICLTQQVPEINGADPATLSKILDNIAYIMPGL